MHRIDQPHLHGRHVVEPGDNLGPRIRRKRRGAIEEIGGIDGAELRDQALVLSPRAQREARPRTARLELREGQAAVAQVAVRPLQHRRDAARLHHRIVDRPHGHAHGQPALGVGRHARILAGVVEQPSRERVDGLQAKAGDPRPPAQQLRGDRTGQSGRGHDHFLLRSVVQARGDCAGQVAIASVVEEGHPEVSGILSDHGPIETLADGAAEGQRIERLGDHAADAHVEIAPAIGGLHFRGEEDHRDRPRLRQIAQ